MSKESGLGSGASGAATAGLPKAGGPAVRDPWSDPVYVSNAKRVLTAIELTKDGAKFEGDPVEGAYEVRRAKRTSDVRQGVEICWLLKKLFPDASFKWIAALLFAMLPLVGARAADAVEPASCSVTNRRSEAETSIPGTFYKSTTLLFTNCVMYSGSTTNARQGLDGVTIDATISDGSTSTSVVASAISTNDGTYWFSVNLSTGLANQANLQIKITDSESNVFIYPWKVLNTRSPLE